MRLLDQARDDALEARVEPRSPFLASLTRIRRPTVRPCSIESRTPARLDSACRPGSLNARRVSNSLTATARTLIRMQERSPRSA